MSGREEQAKAATLAEAIFDVDGNPTDGETTVKVETIDGRDALVIRPEITALIRAYLAAAQADPENVNAETARESLQIVVPVSAVGALRLGIWLLTNLGLGDNPSAGEADEAIERLSASGIGAAIEGLRRD
jgi:hypothetical protein